MDYEYSLQELAEKIIYEQPRTISELFAIVDSYDFKDFKIVPVYYKGVLQGVRLYVGKAILPSKNTVYGIFK